MQNLKESLEHGARLNPTMPMCQAACDDTAAHVLHNSASMRALDNVSVALQRYLM